MHKMLLQTVEATIPIRKTKGDYGLELEVEGQNLPHDVQGWVEHAEGSLRGESVEYVTDGAVSYDTLKKRLETLLGLLSMPPRKVIPSIRTSTHIHINFQRNTFRDILGFILVFLIYEPILVRLCGPTRNGNLFCLPSYDTGDIVKFCQSVCSNLPMGSWPARGKYSLLNTDCLVKFGSIEFRGFPLSTDVTEIMTWVTWLKNIKDVAVNWKTPDYSDLLAELANRHDYGVHHIFTGVGNYRLYEVCSPNNMGDLIHLGLEASYESHRCLLPLLSPKEEVKRPKYGTSIDLVLDDEVPQVMYEDTEEYGYD